MSVEGIKIKKITIEITENEDGSVSIHATPIKVNELIKLIKARPEDVSSAERFALQALGAIHQYSKGNHNRNVDNGSNIIQLNKKIITP